VATSWDPASNALGRGESVLYRGGQAERRNELLVQKGKRRFNLLFKKGPLVAKKVRRRTGKGDLRNSRPDSAPAQRKEEARGEQKEEGVRCAESPSRRKKQAAAGSGSSSYQGKSATLAGGKKNTF